MFSVTTPVLVHPDQRAVAPLFEAQLELKVPDMVFTPSLEFGAGDGFFELVESLINDVLRTSSLVPRLAQHSPSPHYQVQIRCDKLEAAVKKPSSLSDLLLPG